MSKSFLPHGFEAKAYSARISLSALPSFMLHCNLTSQVSFPLSSSHRSLPRPSLISEQFVCSASSVLLAGFICDSWKNEAPGAARAGAKPVRLVLDCVPYFERLVREISNKPSENDTALRISNLPSYRLDVALRNALTNAHLVHTKVRTNRASSK